MQAYNNSGELTHYGVVGMKWGVRKEYKSTGRRVKTYAIPQKKSGHRVRLEAKYLKKGYSDSDAEQMAAKRIRAEKYVTAAGVITVAVAALYLAKNPNVRSKVKELLTSGGQNDIKILSELPKIQGDHSILEDLAAINPNLEKGTEYQKNCSFCNVAFELRRRGFDVEALPLQNPIGLHLDDWKQMYKGLKLEKATRPEDGHGGMTIPEVASRIAKWGEGARGGIYMRAPKDFNHFFNVEVKDGKANFIDPQLNIADVKYYLETAYSITFGRVDNLSFSDIVLNTVKNRL